MSSVDKTSRILLAALLLASALSAPLAVDAFAQSSPKELRPAQDSGIVARDGELVDDEGSKTGVAAPGAVTVQPATHLSLDTLGLYDASSGGLPTDVWKGVDHARALQLFSRLPEAIPSESLRKLVVRLLLSSTEPPQSANIQQSIFQPRVETLLQLGESAQALRLLALVPKDRKNEALNQLEYTAHLLKADTEWPCANVGEHLKSADAPLFWRKLSIFCLAKEGKDAEAQLALDVLNEQGTPLEPAYQALVDGMLKRDPAAKDRFKVPVSLSDAALAALSGLDLFPEGYLEGLAPVPVARLAAGSITQGQDVREQANKRLVALHANEKPTPQQVAMRGWFGQLFGQSTSQAFRFDDALKQTAQKLGASVQTVQAYRFYLLLEALGFEQIERRASLSQAPVKATRTAVAPWARADLAHAAAADRKAEVILLAADVIAQGGSLAEMDDATVVDVITALQQVGLEAEAKALAVEAMAVLY